MIRPVSDLDRAVAFSRDRVGFDLDHRTTDQHVDVAQLTPRGSGCSVVVGTLPAQREMAPAWAVQQLRARGQTPLIPFEARGRFGC